MGFIWNIKYISHRYRVVVWIDHQVDDRRIKAQLHRNSIPQVVIAEQPHISKSLACA